VDAAAAKSEQDGDADAADDVDTPVAHRSPAHMPRSFSDVAGLHRRNSYAGSLQDVLGDLPLEYPEHGRRHLRRTLAVADWLAQVHPVDAGSSAFDDDSLSDAARKMEMTAEDSNVSRWSSADHGFISGLMTESAELDASRLALAAAANHASSIFPASIGITDDDDVHVDRRPNRSTELLHLDQIQILRRPCDRRRPGSALGSVDDACGLRSRRRHSLASSAVSSEYEYRESLVSKGFSVDLGEDLEGIMTPPSTNHGAGVTVAGMETLHQALKQIQRDVDEMNRKFDGLRTSSAVDADQSWSPGGESSVEGGVRFAFVEQSKQEVEDEAVSERQQTDYIWDYRSDLVQEGGGDDFVTLRPIVPSPSGNFVLHRANLPRSYSDLCTEASTGCGTDDGMLDLYIDDDITGMGGAVCERVPEKFETASHTSSDVLGIKSETASSSERIFPAKCHSPHACSCLCDFNRFCCCHHPVSCGHSDSCSAVVNRHCPSHGDVSPPHLRRSSASSHSCCLHHSHHPHHTRLRCTTYSSCFCRDTISTRCNLADRRLSLHRSQEWDCCNNVRHQCDMVRTSTPADDTRPLDHCNNLPDYSVSVSIVGQNSQKTCPVSEKMDISNVIDETFSGHAAVQQVCFCLYFSICL